MAESGQEQSAERSEAPSPRRLQQARERGQVPRSRDLTTSLLLLTAVGALAITGPAVLETLVALTRACFTIVPPPAGEIALPEILSGWVVQVFLAATPFFGLVLAAAALGPVALGGLVISAEAIRPKAERIDPIRGLQRVFSWNGLMELVKALAKFALITGVAALMLWAWLDDLLGVGGAEVAPALAHSTRLLLSALALLSATTLLVAAVDVPFQIWNHAKRLRMTRREVKEEMKDTDGRPEVRGRLRALQRDIANRRMMEAVPAADVVVTNPTHYACALRYRGDRAAAPVLVAKGADLMAARIRAAAEAHGVPVLRAPALARAVYHHTRIGAEIPAGLYLAVAHVLAWVYRCREAGRDAPPPPTDLPVPEDLRRDATS